MMDYKNYTYLTKPQLECVLLQMLSDGHCIPFYLPNAPQTLQQEYCNLNKLANRISYLNENCEIRGFMIEQYQKRVEAYHLLCKQSCYGTLDDLLKE